MSYQDNKTFKERIDFLINKGFLSVAEEKEILGAIDQQNGFSEFLDVVRSQRN